MTIKEALQKQRLGDELIPSFVDCTFHELRNANVTDIDVTKEEMFVIVRYFVANTRDCREELSTGIVKELFGIKIHLREQ